MDVSYRTTLELDKIIARAVQLCTCAETKEMMRAIEPFATTEEERYALTQTNAINHYTAPCTVFPKAHSLLLSALQEYYPYRT